MTMKKLVVTPEQLAEGYVQFVDGVIVARSFTGAERLADGNYRVDDPAAGTNGGYAPPGRLPFVDAR